MALSRFSLSNTMNHVARTIVIASCACSFDEGVRLRAEMARKNMYIRSGDAGGAPKPYAAGGAPAYGAGGGYGGGAAPC